MPVTDLPSWIDEFARQGTVWIAKRLSGNDTLANKSHQAGPYIPKEFLFEVFPSLDDKSVKNPARWFDLYVDSHADHRKVRVIWYNDTYHIDPVKQKKGTRNETRITNLGGKQSPLLDPESTGAIAVFVFELDQAGAAQNCHVWVCDNALEEDMIEDRIGAVEPKAFIIWKPGILPLFAAAPVAVDSPCWLPADKLPPAWLKSFPTGAEIVHKTKELRPDPGLSVDDRLIRRRDCEYELFKSVEEAVYSPKILQGFQNVNSFLSLAQTILQSRKSRSGKSLELHTHDILTEEAFVANKDFAHGAIIEGNKRPDFLFPSVAAYKDASFPDAKLRMLAAKTTCKDRWRQILNEAKRIDTKHLLTLQEGLSAAQFKEMVDEKVKLVVPAKLHASYHVDIRPHLMSLESFLAEVRLAALP